MFLFLKRPIRRITADKAPTQLSESLQRFLIFLSKTTDLI